MARTQAPDCRPCRQTLKLRLDFLPYEERVVSNAGVELKTLSYYDPVLNKWINAVDPKHPKEKRKFIFRWDPRSIKFIWFYDPELKRYFRIPTRDPSRPDISWSEYEEYKDRLRKGGRRARRRRSHLRLPPTGTCARTGGQGADRICP